MSTMSVVHGMTQPLVEGGVDSRESEVPVTGITDMHYGRRPQVGVSRLWKQLHWQLTAVNR